MRPSPDRLLSEGAWFRGRQAKHGWVEGINDYEAHSSPSWSRFHRPLLSRLHIAGSPAIVVRLRSYRHFDGWGRSHVRLIPRMHRGLAGDGSALLQTAASPR